MVDIYCHIINKWAKDYIGKTVDETKILMKEKLPKFELHIINVNEEDPNLDIALRDLLRFQKEKTTYTPYMYYPQKYFEPPINGKMQVIEYKGVIVDTMIY
jgi:hypothetical protein